jgi:hypothetical protein
MRQRLQAFLPIVLIVLMVQILAPIGASFASAVAADPVHAAPICHGATDAPASPDLPDDQRLHLACMLCCAAQAQAAFDAPSPEALAAPLRWSGVIVWRLAAARIAVTSVHASAQARAPPSTA